MIQRSVFAFALCVACMLNACGQAPQAADQVRALLAGDQLAPVDPQTVSGAIEITGSSTVYPLTARIAEDFAADGSPAQIDIKITGTGGGLRAFCNGDPVELVNASRPISDEEIAACQSVGREAVGFQVGIDALAVVVNPANTFLQSLSFAQLAQIFTGQATMWNQVDPSYPAASIAVFSPGVDSGTFDYFVEEVLDGEGAALENLAGALLSESDTELTRGIEGNPNAIGYFGYAYYQAEGALLRAVPIDDGAGPVASGSESVGDGSYPFARPLFVYSSAKDLREHPAAAAFLSYYLQHVSEVIDDVGYFPVTDATLAESQQQLVATLQ